MVALTGERVIATTCWLPTVTAAVPVCVRSANDVAMTCTRGGLGTVGGAVYRPSAVIIPQDVPAHPLPERLHNTTPFPEPVAEN